LLGGGAPLVAATLAGALKGRFAADIVASLAIVAALVLGQYFAGVIIVLMQSGGEALEDFAMRRASQSIEALLARAPKIAHRVRPDTDTIEDIQVEDVAIGDVLILKPGDLVPVDGVVAEGKANIDTAAVTGEPAPLKAGPGTPLLSGCVNLGGVIHLVASHPADQSQYQQIVHLVDEARAERPPIQRIADRAAVWFTPLTLAMCVVAWLVTHRAEAVLAVLVVATPCPLILATPVAVIAGMGRAAAQGIVVRRGAAIEQAGQVRIVVFDKTGTLTLGRPVVERVVTTDGFDPDRVLRAAAAVEQHSSHHLGRAIMEAGRARFGALPQPAGFHETAGAGVEGMVEGRQVEVGSAAYLRSPELTLPEEETATYVRVDGCPAGAIVFADRLREEARETIARLARMGLRDTWMLTGDRERVAQRIAAEAGIRTVEAELLPAQKVEALGRLRRRYGTIMMVGDGINDAPALASATVGVAMGAHAPAAAAAAADIVVLVDDVSRVADAIVISRRTRQVALQSILAGIGLSLFLMVIASTGAIRPAFGALLQEAIDAAVILNALRARSGGAAAAPPA